MSVNRVFNVDPFPARRWRHDCRIRARPIWRVMTLSDNNVRWTSDWDFNQKKINLSLLHSEATDLISGHCKRNVVTSYFIAHSTAALFNAVYWRDHFRYTKISLHDFRPSMLLHRRLIEIVVCLCNVYCGQTLQDKLLVYSRIWIWSQHITIDIIFDSMGPP